MTCSHNIPLGTQCLSNESKKLSENSENGGSSVSSDSREGIVSSASNMSRVNSVNSVSSLGGIFLYNNNSSYICRVVGVENA